VKDLKAEWGTLRPFGIDPTKYTVKDEETGLLARESYELPLPAFASQVEQKGVQATLKEKELVIEEETE
jgi:hypothetical protein